MYQQSIFEQKIGGGGISSENCHFTTIKIRIILNRHVCLIEYVYVCLKMIFKENFRTALEKLVSILDFGVKTFLFKRAMYTIFILLL